MEFKSDNLGHTAKEVHKRHLNPGVFLKKIQMFNIKILEELI